jgi:YaiO family outer membrane protein
LRGAGAALLLAVAGAASAQDTQAPVDRVGVQAEHFRLDHGRGDWDETALQLTRQWTVRDVAELALSRTRRFGLEDTEVRAGGSRAFGPRLTASVQATTSPTHRVLPRGSLGGALAYEVAPAWLLHGGLRHTAYDNTDVDQARVGLERYVGDFSLLAAWSPARAVGRSTDGYEARASWYGGNGASAGLLLAWGQEAAQLGAGQVALADVRTIALLGRQPIGPRLWITWSASRTRQGDFYTRTGGTLGLQAAF